MEPIPDALPDEQCELQICQEGTIWATGVTSCARPDFQNVEVIGVCEHGCAYGVLMPLAGNPCLPGPPEVYRCDERGRCAPGEARSCAMPLACGATATVGACTCGADGWSCEPACDSGLCDPDEVQAAIVGTWSGTVTTSFGPPYETTVTISADGMWSSPGEPFYWGGGGGLPGCGVYVLAQSAEGATGIVRLALGQAEIQFTKLRVDASRLRFELTDSWLACTTTLMFDLVRTD